MISTTKNLSSTKPQPVVEKGTKSLRMLYLAFIRLPTEKAHGVQIMKTCEAFADAGVNVELVIPVRKTHITEDLFEYYGVRQNFTLTSLKTPDWVGWGPLGFAVSALWFSEIAKWRKSFWQADIIYSRDAFVLLQYLLLGRKLVYEAHTKPTFVSTFVARRVYRLIVISEGLRDAYVATGIPKEKITVAHDAVDPEPFKKQYDQKESREWLGVPLDKKIALYVGRVDAAKGADTFAASSEYVFDDWICVLIGSGPLAFAEELKKKYPRALFLPETPYRELPRVLASADVLVLPNSAKDENSARYTSPLKAFAYMASGKPIIASNVPALREVLKNNAVFVEPDNPRDLASALQTFPENDTVEVRVYTWSDRAKDILTYL